MEGKKEAEDIAFIGTYPPRKCGIATFTQDLSSTIDKISNPTKTKIVAMNDNGNSYDYPDEVIATTQDKDLWDYIKTAKEINENDQIKAVSIQHEFKIFGSDYGENLVFFFKEIKKPVITTFHAVFPKPSTKRKWIIKSIADNSKYVVVMSKLAAEILKSDYNIDESKIAIIPHGIHDVPFEQTTPFKEKFGYSNKNILSSFGLLRPGRGRISAGKGFEYVLDALPKIIEKFPNTLYLIIGATHPKTLKLEGEKYRDSLKDKIQDLGIQKNVEFIDKYLKLNELLQYLKATDIYICSILNPQQVTSGTLVYAMGCGCAVVSTPFYHAQELISPERGILLEEFRNPKLISNAIIKTLSNPELKKTFRRNAYDYTRKMTWEKVARTHKELFNGLS